MNQLQARLLAAGLGWKNEENQEEKETFRSRFVVFLLGFVIGCCTLASCQFIL